MKESVRLKAKAMKGINELLLKGEIVIFGSTYMAGFPFYELVNKCKFENAIYNRSIEGLTLAEAQELMQSCVIDIAPRKVFLALGEEDAEDPEAVSRYSEIVKRLRQKLPNTHLYLIGLAGEGSYVDDFNHRIMALCDDKMISYIQLICAVAPDVALCKARFKQLCSFFRHQPISLSDALAMAEL